MLSARSRCPPTAAAPSLPCPYLPLAVAGLEGEVSKLLAAARAVQQQYAIKAAGADSRGAGEERAVDQQRHGGGSAAAAAEGAAADVAMREAGEV